MEAQQTEYDLDPEWAPLFGRAAGVERSVVETLRDVSLFALLDSSDLERLARVVHVRHYASGEVIVQAGIPQSGVYVIRSGSVNVVTDQPGRQSRITGVLGPGEIMGEFSLVDGMPRSSTLVAAEPSELIGFFRPDLLGILQTQPRIGCRILLRLGKSLARTLYQQYTALLECGYPSSFQEPVAPAVAEGSGV